MITIEVAPRRWLPSLERPVWALALLLVPLACSGGAGAGATPSPTTPLDDAGPETPGADAGLGSEASAPWSGPAAHPAMPQVVDYGGVVLASPEFQPIVFAGDPLEQDITALASSLAGSAYWSTIASEYGVGALRSLPLVAVSETAPPAVTDAEVESWLASKIATSQVPVPDDNIIYVVYYPSGTVVTSSLGTSCTDFYGYHDQVTSPAGAAYAYAVVPRCHDSIHVDLDNVTNITGHELLEAATDPYELTRPAYATVDAAHAVWTVAAGGESELADMCQLMPGAAYSHPSGLPYALPRTWSNAAAATSHDPCVPAPAGAYFNSAPVLPDTVTIPVGSASITTQAVKIGVLESRTIDVVLYSDAPTAGPWKVEALDLATLAGKPAELKLELEPSYGQDGDVLQLTITPLQEGSKGLETFYVASGLEGRSSLWVGLVTNQ